jgi:glycerophosphoryl diester phosphodiesterase
VNVEIKNLPHEPDFDPRETVADAVVALVRDLGVTPRIIVSSFHLPTIDRVRSLDASLATAYLTPTATTTDIDRAVRHGHGAFHPWHIALIEPIVDAAHEAGLELNTWTIDDPARMTELISWGVDGLITNVPDLARRVVDGS